jgi:hypothetical protein
MFEPFVSPPPATRTVTLIRKKAALFRIDAGGSIRVFREILLLLTKLFAVVDCRMHIPIDAPMRFEKSKSSCDNCRRERSFASLNALRSRTPNANHSGPCLPW